MPTKTFRKSSEHEQVWKNCLDIIKDNIDESSFNTWFLPIIPVSLEDATLTIQVPSHLYYEFLEEIFLTC